MFWRIWSNLNSHYLIWKGGLNLKKNKKKSNWGRTVKSECLLLKILFIIIKKIMKKHSNNQCYSWIHSWLMSSDLEMSGPGDIQTQTAGSGD